MNVRLRRLGLLLSGTLVALLLAEVSLRIVSPWRIRRPMQRLEWFDNHAPQFTVDPEIGFRPVLGGGTYDEHGVIRNQHALDKRPGVTRVLFVGDSVTRRGHIVAAIQERFGTASREYLNAGVESFNTMQEVLYYRRHNRGVRPDHVVLTFHLNDFQSTPVAFVDEQGRFSVFAHRYSPRHVDPWWFEHCHLYRLLHVLTISDRRSVEQFADDVRNSLVEFRELLQADGTRLTVLVLPAMRPLGEWTAQERAAHERILALCGELGITSLDLLPVLEEALARGIGYQEPPGDPWHPSAAFGALVAAWLERQGWSP